MTSPKRVALYLRVSTNNGHQTTENQLRELIPTAGNCDSLGIPKSAKL